MTIIPPKIMRLSSPPLEIILRSPIPADAPAFAAYLKQMYAESYRNLNAPKERFDHTPETEHAASLQRSMDDPHAFLIAAFEGEDVVGTFNLKPETAPFLAHCAAFGMAVLVRMQGIGLGRALLEYGLAEAEKNGRTNITLHVRTHNLPAIRLYEAAGFERVGVLKRYARVDGTFVDEFIYQRLSVQTFPG